MASFKTFNAGDLLSSGDLNNYLIGNNYTGTRALVQGGNNIVTTDVNGDVTMTFATAFPNACTCVLAFPGDKAVNFAQVRIKNGLITTTQWGFQAITAAGAACVTLQIRVLWMAFGR